MGDTAAPPAPITAARVAQHFVAVYYRVAEKMPQRLPQLYGPNSELQHATHHAAGPEQIARLAPSLPLANADVTIRSFSAQRTGSDSFVVAVIGSFVKLVAESTPTSFSQTFVLEKQSDSHNEHFFCRNDLFSIVSPDSPIDPSTVPVTSAPTQDLPETVHSTDHLTSDPIESQPSTDLDPIPAPISVPRPMESRPADHSPPRSHSEPNGTAQLVDHVEPSTSSPPSAPISMPPPDTPVSPNPIPNGTGDTHSTPPSKKTWASIVSSKEDASVSLPDPVAEQTDIIPQEDVKSIPPPRPAPTLPNGHRPPTVPRNGPRNFGPSAVVQLSALSADKMPDLKNSLRDEFSQYGFKLRNVEIKAAKGIAFVEYESIDGVKAAVAAWANGPREEGTFAGIPLSVTEKRPTHSNRRPSSARGGRGGPRGGRRNRPASTPLS